MNETEATAVYVAGAEYQILLHRKVRKVGVHRLIQMKTVGIRVEHETSSNSRLLVVDFAVILHSNCVVLSMNDATEVLVLQQE